MTTGRSAVVVAGLPGTGKSTFAGHVAALMPSIVVIDKDAIVGPLVEAALRGAGEDVDLDGAFYKRYLSPAAYEVIEAMASAVLSAGSTPALVAPYERALDDPDFPRTMSDRLDAEVHVVWMQTVVDVAHRRLTERAAGRDISKLARWDEYTQRAAFGHTPPWPHQLVDTSDSDAAGPLSAAHDLVRRLQGQ